MRTLIPSIVAFVWGTAATLGNLLGSSEPSGGAAYNAGRSTAQVFMVVLAIAGAAGIVRWYRAQRA